jgi:hypothetical protein
VKQPEFDFTTEVCGIIRLERKSTALQNHVYSLCLPPPLLTAAKTTQSAEGSIKYAAMQAIYAVPSKIRYLVQICINIFPELCLNHFPNLIILFAHVHHQASVQESVFCTAPLHPKGREQILAPGIQYTVVDNPPYRTYRESEPRMNKFR